MSSLARQLLDLEFVTPDVEVIARQIALSRRPGPSTADLANAITHIQITDTTKGSSTLVISVLDPNWTLLDSGFFDTDSDSKIDPVDINYPDESKYWWRLTQTSPSANFTLELTLMERAAVYLMTHHGPLKTSRARRTRAEFMKMLCDRVKAGGGIDFHSRQLHTKQTTAVSSDPFNAPAKRKNKDRGINPHAKVKVKGVQATKSQLRLAERALNSAAKLDPPELAVVAMICATIGESTLSTAVNSIGYGGILGGDVSHHFNYFTKDDAEGEAHYFMVGGRGYQAGGAIALARAHPNMDPGEIANRVEASGAGAHFYGQWRGEAEAIIRAYGGATAAQAAEHKQYNFEVGTADNPYETYWDAGNRLAEEVAWDFFLDGNDAYFDSELTLIQQMPIAVVHRDDPAVLDWDYVWDVRHIATEFHLTLMCGPFDYRAGEVFQMDGFGTASTGSTAKLPGRWLITNIERDRSALSSAFTLSQPARPLKEPAPAITDTGTSGQSSRNARIDSIDPSHLSGTPQEIIDTYVLPIGRKHGLKTSAGAALNSKNVTTANASHGSVTNGGRSDHQGPPNVAWAVDMSNGWLTVNEKNCAKELAGAFQIPWTGKGIAQATHGGYRYQLIWGVDLGQAGGGEHRNHVHFGVRVAG